MATNVNTSTTADDLSKENEAKELNSSLSEDSGTQDAFNEELSSEGDKAGDSSGTSLEDVDEDELNNLPALMMRINSRIDVPKLPDTVTKLKRPDGSLVYLVGTAHFSHESQEDVAKTIQAVKPDIIVLELCKSRLSVLQLDEKTVLEESKNLNISRMRSVIKQSGFFQGVMYIMLLSMSANVTKSLGMAPGGEFRRAAKESQTIPGCLIHLGDRPIQITMQRALSSLSWTQSFRLMWQLLFYQESITVEDVERCKQRDLLEEMLLEMTGDYPALSNVFVHERDVYLTNSLQEAACPMLTVTGARIPSVVVGVVGIGHVPGILKQWNKVSEKDIGPIMKIPPKTLSSKIIKITFKVSIYGLAAWGIYKLMPSSVKSQVPSANSVADKIRSFWLRN